MTDFTEVTIPKFVNREMLKKSWRKTVEACNELLARFSEHQLTQVAGRVPEQLAHGSHKARLSGIMAVYRWEMDQVRRQALETESFRRVYRRDQDLLRTNFTSKLSLEEQRRVRELLVQIQRNEIQAAQRKQRNLSSGRRSKKAKKAQRRIEDRQRTLQMKGRKQPTPV